MLRTRFFDDYLLQARTAGCAQVVLLAAGLDSRAYRLPWPVGTRLFELDLPDVLTFKERVLRDVGAAVQVERVAVPVDLRADWASMAHDAGLDPSEPTAWLCEGLLIYLSAEEADHVLTTVTALSTPGSQIALEPRSALGTTLAARAHAMPTMDPYTSLWKGGLGPDAADWLTHRGWSVTTHDRAALAASYGRTASDSEAGGFLTATRQARP